MLGGELLAKRRPLLDNPYYPQDLTETFGNADFQVVGWSWHQSKRLTVDVRIVFDANESVKWRLVLQRDSALKAGLLIVDTTTITD